MVHIGDSRAYLLRDGEFDQITKDDTYVQMLVDEGRISPEEASSHPQRSLLTRALDGRDVDPEYSVRQVPRRRPLPDLQRRALRVVSAETIGDTLREYTDPQTVRRAAGAARAARRRPGQHHRRSSPTPPTRTSSRPHRSWAAPPPGTGAMATSADVSTPAARASALQTPRPASPEEEPSAARDDDRPRRRPLRTALLLVLVAALLGGGVWGGWEYTQRQYYVGVTDDGTARRLPGRPGPDRRFRPLHRAQRQRASTSTT